MHSRMRCTACRTGCAADPVRRRGGGTTAAPPGARGGAREVEEMGALSIVKSQRVSERVKDLIGGAGGVPALQAFVVLDAHTREGGDLFAAQAGHAPPTVAR